MSLPRWREPSQSDQRKLRKHQLLLRKLRIQRGKRRRLPKNKPEYSNKIQELWICLHQVLEMLWPQVRKLLVSPLWNFLILLVAYGLPFCIRYKGMMAAVPDQPPNQILFLTNLPDETNEMMLSMLFNQYVTLLTPWVPYILLACFCWILTCPALLVFFFSSFV